MSRIPPFVCLVALGCTGDIGAANPAELEIPAPAEPDVEPVLPSGGFLAEQGLTRLSALELDRSLAILLGDESRPSREVLPEDARTPFDNDYTSQEASKALIEGEELLAREAAERLIADAERRDRLIGCTPSGPSDRACLASFVETFGRRALRRPLTEDEVRFFVDGQVDGEGEWPGGLSIAEGFDDFNEGVLALVQVFLQDPEFLYRVEAGTPHEEAEGVFRLNDYEIATRLSFFLWGSIPDDALLDAAERGELTDADGRLAQAERLLGDARARERFALFHAMWLGYEKLLPGSELGNAMRNETRALTDRVLFEDEGPWQDLFRYERTYVNALLAENYGMPEPEGNGDWVDYAMDERRGLFAHGSFLSIGFRAGDTSPVMRGLAIARNAFCQTIDPAPPGVNTDEGPVSDALCKPERYAAHSEGGCASCHLRIDPIGFGLEGFDAQGRHREFEVDDPQTDDDESTCRIEGRGELNGVGEFSGPGGLAELGLSSGLLRSCFVTHVHRLLVGRGELGHMDQAVINELDARLPEGDFSLRDVIQAVVRHESFTLRRTEGEGE
ncbi:MAG: DUF1592 domain-containing protein [Myxococcota bacterium]